MASVPKAIQRSKILKPKSILIESILAYVRLIPGIIIKGVFLGCIVYSLFIIPLPTFISSSIPIANYLVIGVLIELLISFILLAKFRNINKLSHYKLSQVIPYDLTNPKENQPSITTKNRISSFILYVRRQWLWVTMALFTDISIIIWIMLSPPDPNSLKYYVLTIILYPVLFPCIIGKIGQIIYYLKQVLPSALPSKQESVSLAIVAIVLMTPLYFNNDVGMPSYVSNYERSGFFKSFESLYADGNESRKIENIVNWSAAHFNNLYSDGFAIRFSPLIMGSIIPPTLTIRPDTRNTSLASKYVLIVQSGNCEESALASLGLAQMAGIPVRQVAFHGEDHTFTEMYIDDHWIIIDPLTGYNGNGYDVPPRFYENNWKYKVSYAEAIYPNGTIEDVTYRYTDMGTILVRVVDQSNHTIANATVNVNSLNRANMATNLTKTTGTDGSVVLKLGDGRYMLTASNNTLMGSTYYPILLNASETKMVTITLNDMNTLNLINEIDNNIAYYITWVISALVGTILTYILLHIYNNRYLKVIVYGFYTILLIFILSTLAKTFIIF